MAAQVFQIGQLLVGFDAFGYDFQPQAMGHGNYSVDDAGLVVAAADTPDKGLVDFQGVDGQAGDVIE